MKRLLIILMIGASLMLVKDFINLMNGATYTWFGVVTSLINIVIVGKSLDELRG